MSTRTLALSHNKRGHENSFDLIFDLHQLGNFDLLLHNPTKHKNLRVLEAVDIYAFVGQFVNDI